MCLVYLPFSHIKNEVLYLIICVDDLCTCNLYGMVWYFHNGQAKHCWETKNLPLYICLSKYHLLRKTFCVDKFSCNQNQFISKTLSNPVIKNFFHYQVQKFSHRFHIIVQSTLRFVTEWGAFIRWRTDITYHRKWHVRNIDGFASFDCFLDR